MIKVAEAINSFAPTTAQQVHETPEEPIFVLTSSQIKDIIERAIQPLQDEVRDLKGTVANLEDKVSNLEATQDTQADNELNMLRLIADLRKDKEPQPLQKDRGKILRALVAANGGKMLAKEARQKMRMSRSHFSELLATMKSYIEIKPYHLKKSARVLILK
jgi:hypothetical protein